MEPIRVTADLALAPSSERDGERWSRVLHAGVDTGVETPGVVLEAQFEAAPFRLLVTSQDVPYEEQLDVVLLDEAFALLERATIGAPYVTGAFRDPRIEAIDAIGFSFYAEDAWRVTLFPEPRLRWPWGETAALGRPFGLRRRFSVSRRS